MIIRYIIAINIDGKDCPIMVTTKDGFLSEEESDDFINTSAKARCFVATLKDGNKIGIPEAKMKDVYFTAWSVPCEDNDD